MNAIAPSGGGCDHLRVAALPANMGNTGNPYGNSGGPGMQIRRSEIIGAQLQQLDDSMKTRGLFGQGEAGSFLRTRFKLNEGLTGPSLIRGEAGTARSKTAHGFQYGDEVTQFKDDHQIESSEVSSSCWKSLGNGMTLGVLDDIAEGTCLTDGKFDAWKTAGTALKMAAFGVLLSPAIVGATVAGGAALVGAGLAAIGAFTAGSKVVSGLFDLFSSKTKKREKPKIAFEVGKSISNTVLNLFGARWFAKKGQKLKEQSAPKFAEKTGEIVTAGVSKFATRFGWLNRTFNPWASPGTTGISTIAVAKGVALAPVKFVTNFPRVVSNGALSSLSLSASELGPLSFQSQMDEENPYKQKTEKMLEALEKRYGDLDTPPGKRVYMKDGSFYVLDPAGNLLTYIHHNYIPPSELGNQTMSQQPYGQQAQTSPMFAAAIPKGPGVSGGINAGTF